MSTGEMPSQPGRQVVLITGMSRGFGERLATAFWSTGADLFGTARDLQALEAVARKLMASPARAGQRIAVVKADLENAAAPEFVVRQCWDQLGGIDVLISNAAVQGPIGRFWEQDPARLENAVMVDLLAPLRLAHAAVPLMLRGAKKGRSILFLSGGGATGPRPQFGAYAAAKAGLVRFAETLAVELSEFEISVNCIAPGVMATDMLAEVAAAGINLAGAGEIAAVGRAKETTEATMTRAADLAVFLATAGLGITGKLIAAQWDRWEDWALHLDELNSSDVYTLRRITGRDRNKQWGDR
jgi:NAD(P)-dependent dehydrogenase (short-subunit alcohol dehydrogenase family)